MGRIGNFLQTDKRKNPIQVSNGIVCIDGSASPISSPKSVTSGAAVTFTPPANAILFIFTATNAVRYSNLADVSAYRKGPASTEIVIPCAGGAPIYMKAESTTADVDFDYEVL
jgi:hypothetical protein